jgi:hypothetical protein
MCVFFFQCWGSNPGPGNLQGKCSPTELYPQSCVCWERVKEKINADAFFPSWAHDFQMQIPFCHPTLSWLLTRILARWPRPGSWVGSWGPGLLQAVLALTSGFLPICSSVYNYPAWPLSPVHWSERSPGQGLCFLLWQSLHSVHSVCLL